MAQLNDLIVTGNSRFVNDINGYIGAGRKAGSTQGQYSTAEGYNNVADGNYSHAEGESTSAIGQDSHAEGSVSSAISGGHAEGRGSSASGSGSHAEGYRTYAYGNMGSHSEGASSRAGGLGSHAEGNFTCAGGSNSHAEGNHTTAYGVDSHAEGEYTCAKGDYSHTEGYYTYAGGSYSHTEGLKTTTSGLYSHAEGYKTSAYAEAHAEGYQTTCQGNRGAHAEGCNTKVMGTNMYSGHAEGYYTTVSGDYGAHAGGQYTCAAGNSQTVIGKYNVPNTEDAFIIGGGTSSSTKKNIFNVDWNGDVYAGRSNGLVNNTKLPTGADVVSHLKGSRFCKINVGSASRTTDQYGQFNLAISNSYVFACWVDYRYWVMRHGENSFRLMNQSSHTVVANTQVTVVYLYGVLYA